MRDAKGWIDFSEAPLVVRDQALRRPPGLGEFIYKVFQGADSAPWVVYFDNPGGRPIKAQRLAPFRVLT